jgi:uncharacterized membrane protein
MKKNFKLYLVTMGLFFAIDFIWLSSMIGPFYTPYLGPLLEDEPLISRGIAALLFYCIYIAGLCYFALVPAVRHNSPLVAAKRGALYGFFTYSTYDLTNQATLQDWSWIVTSVDIVWGTLLSGGIAFAVAYLFVPKFGR